MKLKKLMKYISNTELVIIKDSQGNKYTGAKGACKDYYFNNNKIKNIYSDNLGALTIIIE